VFEKYADTLRYILGRTEQIILPAYENRDMTCILLALFEELKLWITLKYIYKYDCKLMICIKAYKEKVDGSSTE